ncbi:DNA-binding response regulator, OmpR family, contains REC and winged-helix (wHTH) domain [Marinitoga hydrogenitolerans DSM 16785]|uniref:DNA-binding response regulator, OmpR family, contains REC and winged-helix (WHTH) domain n=1 Tax=Marinitoga hydrogenitolerans (strain DSM 16785 / JCM 12826 / AT1271) TaxID=1122195 RepID=A0A1M4X0F8_MARH1|nr:response regulator transcription factor [Marinitoga hydrogenitolerans]SHE87001.1 DNA-binding response regulator, OmpR family, contains REC and winged-helix (wHTH) domain [Marinitoga hydrogenitolerans DSM 16785]
MGKRVIMIIEDDPAISEMLNFNLTKEGYDIILASDADEAVKMIEEKEVDFFIVDIMLPGSMDGFDFIRTVKSNEKFKNAPVLILSAKDDPADKVAGLELGSDDYVTKPFNVRELIARIKSIFRRQQQAMQIKEEGPKKIVAKDLEIDTERYEVLIRGNPVELTPLEFELLTFLAKNEGKVFSRDVLLDKLWGYDYFGDTRTVDVHIRRLRTKIEEDPSNPKYIITVRGKGYKFRDPGKEKLDY